MSTDTELWDLLSPRLDAAEKYFSDWAERFKCETLNDYYEGYQWKGQNSSDPPPYVINLVYSTIEVKRPNLLFQTPQFSIEPQPSQSDFDPESAWITAKLKSDTLNTVVMANMEEIGVECDLSILDSFFYFGLMEVGYDATWIKNPKLPHSVLPTDYKADVKFRAVPDLEEIPEEERIYFKRIPAHTFRVPAYQSFARLRKYDWCGYYEWVRRDDVVTNKFFSLEDISKDTATPPTANLSNISTQDEATQIEVGGLVKIWRIWDNRRKVFEIYCPSFSRRIFVEPFDFLPLAPLVFSRRRKGFYPIPPASQWKSSQDEQNEVREQLRNMRRRAKRLYQTLEGTLDEDQEEKLISGPDSTVIKFRQGQGLQPVMPPPVDSVVSNSLVISKDDFNIISGTTSEARGVSDRTTATQASITNQRAGIREFSAREVVGKWLCEIGKLALKTMIAKFTLPTWIKINTEPQLGQEIQEIQTTYQKIAVEDIDDGMDFKVTINVASLSPVAGEEEKRAYLEFLALISQYPAISLSPTLIRETAHRVGYRNEQVIREMQKAAQIQMFAQMAASGQGQAQPIGGPQNVDQRTATAMQPPAQNEIDAQLNNQGIPLEMQ